MHPYYTTHLNSDVKQTPAVYHYYKRCLSIPMFYGITDDQVDYVAHTMQNILSESA